MVTRFQQLENWGRHQMWWNSVKPQAWRQCLLFLLVPAGSGALRPSTIISHADLVCSKHGMLECTQLPGNLTYQCQYVRYEIWSLACWNKHSQIVNIWLHIHIITSKQICSKYLFFLLHFTLHWKSSSFSSDDMNIKYACVVYFSDIPLTAGFFTCTVLDSILWPLWNSEIFKSNGNIHLNWIR